MALHPALKVIDFFPSYMSVVNVKDEHSTCFIYLWQQQRSEDIYGHSFVFIKKTPCIITPHHNANVIIPVAEQETQENAIT